MEKFELKTKLLNILGSEIQHLDDLRELLVCFDIKKHQLRKIYLLQDLLKSLSLEIYNSINNESK